MDYLFERRRRRRRRGRNYQSPSSYDRTSSRDEEEIEQEIIERYVKEILMSCERDLIVC